MQIEYERATIQMPEQGSTLAPIVDQLYYEIFWISVVFFVAIVGAMVIFAWRFRRRKGVSSKPPGHHTVLELFWTFSPLILLGYMFHQGFDGFMMMSIPPENAINIRARAQQWSWSFEQPNGLVDASLRVPVGRPVRMIMSSIPRADRGAVLHSFFVPAFRVKRDIVPGMYTSLWFEATDVRPENERFEMDGNERRRDAAGNFIPIPIPYPGRAYQIYCTEYCGQDHSTMLSTAYVMSQPDYDAYLREGPQCPSELEEDWQWGERLFVEYNCPSCHFVDPADGVRVGPNLANVAGTMQPLEGGQEALADADYLRESVMQPQARIVRGYTSASMSASEPSSRPMDALIAYLAHISSEGGEMARSQHCGAAGAARAAEEDQ